MRVVDASILASFIRKEPGWEKLADYVKLCITVDLALKEVLNAIFKDFSLRKSINLDVALKLREILFSMIGTNVFIEPEDKYISKGFEIALKTSLTIYDTLYIALAAEKKLPLVTLDEKQARAAQALSVEVIIPSI